MKPEEMVKEETLKEDWARETFLMHVLGRDEHENSNRRK